MKIKLLFLSLVTPITIILAQTNKMDIKSTETLIKMLENVGGVSYHEDELIIVDSLNDGRFIIFPIIGNKGLLIENKDITDSLIKNRNFPRVTENPLIIYSNELNNIDKTYDSFFLNHLKKKYNKANFDYTEKDLMALNELLKKSKYDEFDELCLVLYFNYWIKELVNGTWHFVRKSESFETSTNIQVVDPKNDNTYTFSKDFFEWWYNKNWKKSKGIDLVFLFKNYLQIEVYTNDDENEDSLMVSPPIFNSLEEIRIDL